VYLIGRARGANRSGAGVEGGTGRNTLSLIQRLAMAFSLLNSSGRLHIAHLRILGLTLVSSVSAVCRPRWERTGTAYILPKKPVSSPQRPRRNDRYLRQRQVCGRDWGWGLGRYLPRAQPPPGLSDTAPRAALCAVSCSFSFSFSRPCLLLGSYFVC
jgi:hypothetical protein